MKKSKKGIKTKILPLEAKRRVRSKTKNISEVTRSLFAETWRNYLDEVSMVSIKVKEKGTKGAKSLKKEVKLKKSKKLKKLSLVK